MKDCVSKYIPVPCGHCAECVALRTASVVQRVELESKYGYPFFITLTYNNDSLPVHTCSDGRKIRFADYKDVQNMFKRLRKSNVMGRRFRFYGVSELGCKHARPHFHLILFLERKNGDSVYTPVNLESLVFQSILSEWRRNYGSNRNPDYRPLCTFIQKFIGGKLNSTFDCHYVVPSAQNGTSQDVSYYVTKYLLKNSDVRDRMRFGLKSALSLDEFYEVWNKVKPRSFSSLNFGFGYYGDLNPKKTPKSERLALLKSLPSSDIVRSSIKRSIRVSDTPKFFSDQSGKGLPLSRYWYKFGDIYTIQDALSFYYKESYKNRADNVVMDDRTLTSKLLSEQRYIKNIKSSDSNLNFDLFYGND